MAEWASLPKDLVRRISDSVLAANDLDTYMDFRAVCKNWRKATDNPKEHPNDLRFYPRRWIILDETSDDTRRLLVNTETGRFLHMELVLLRHYYVVGTTLGGFFVMADRDDGSRPPESEDHPTVRLFNPFTGVAICFAAPMPPGAGLPEVCCYGHSKGLHLYLLSDSSCEMHIATPGCESFLSYDRQEFGLFIGDDSDPLDIDAEDEQGVHNFLDYNFFRNLVLGGVYPPISMPAVAHAFDAFLDFMDPEDPGEIAIGFNGGIPGDPAYDRDGFFVGLDAHVFLVAKRDYQGTKPLVCKMNPDPDPELSRFQPVQSINNFAIFIGHRRCLPVDANNFPGIEANCLYYTELSGTGRRNSSAHICKYNLEEGKVERISQAAAFVQQEEDQFVLVADRPFTIIQLLCSYTITRIES